MLLCSYTAVTIQIVTKCLIHSEDIAYLYVHANDKVILMISTQAKQLNNYTQISLELFVQDRTLHVMQLYRLFAINADYHHCHYDNNNIYSVPELTSLILDPSLFFWSPN